MKSDDSKGPTPQSRRKARLAEALRNNMALRKARSRAATADSSKAKVKGGDVGISVPDDSLTTKDKSGV